MKQKYRLSDGNVCNISFKIPSELLTEFGAAAKLSRTDFNENSNNNDSNTNESNNNNSVSFIKHGTRKFAMSLGYEFVMLSSECGIVRFAAGHQKIDFMIAHKQVVCCVNSGKLKVIRGTQEIMAKKNDLIKIRPKCKCQVQNNSLRKFCVVFFMLIPSH